MRALEEAGSPKLWLLALSVVAAIVVVPVMAAVTLSFAQTESGTAVFGVEAYRRLVRAPELTSLWHVLQRGLVVASLSQLLALPVGFHLATRRSPAIRLTLIGLMLAPFFCSDAIRAYTWSRILSADGFLFRTLNTFPAILHIDSLRFSEPAVAVALCSATIPFSVIAVVASLPGGDEDLWLASRDLGSSKFWEFWQLAVPAAIPGLAVGWIFQLLMSSFSSVEEQYLGNSTSMQKIANGMINADLGAGSRAFFALSSLIVLLLIAALFATGWLIKSRGNVAARIAKVVEGAAVITLDIRAKLRSTVTPRHAPILSGKLLEVSSRLPSPFVVLCNVLMIGCYMLVLAPVVGAIVLAFRDGSGSGANWTLQNFRGALEGGSLIWAVSRSLTLAFVVGLLCAMLSVLLATVVWRSMICRGLVLVLVVTGALLPAETYALSMLCVAHAIGIESGGLWLAALGDMAWALPFATGAMLLAYQRIEISLLEAAWEFGEGAWTMLGRVVIRTTMPAVVGSALFGFLLALNEYSRGLYLGGGVEFLSTRVFGRMQSGLVGDGRQIFAVAGSLVALSFFLFSLGVLHVALARKRQNE